MPRRERVSELEREGWQLLLWSYRHELDVNDTTPTNRPADPMTDEWDLSPDTRPPL